MASGFLLKLFQTLVPFLLRSVMIYKMGMEYVGLDGLFSSILHVLNLTELGVGSAMVYSMYKPIANDDETKLKALLNLYKLYYRLIGVFVLVGGLILIPFLPKLISGDVPSGVNLYVLFVINLLATVASYWLFAYKTSLLMAHQKTSISNNILLVSFVVRYTLQFIAIFAFRNIYFYFMAILLAQLLTNLLTCIITDRLYPRYKPVGALSEEDRKDINAHIRDLFTAKLGATVTNSADAVVISSFLGLTVLAKYHNYYYILSALFGFMIIIFQSCLAGIGNSLVVEKTEKNYRDFETFSMFLTWIIGFCSTGIFCLIQPFMKIWVHQQNMLDDSFALLFSIYFYVYEIALIWSTYKDAGGIWHKDRFRPLCVTVVNLGLNLIFVNFLGLYGVIMSTVISYLFVGMPWLIHNIFTTLFKRNPKNYLLKIVFGVFVTVVSCAVSRFACGFVSIEGVVGFLLKGAIVTVLSNAVFVAFYCKTKDFAEVKKLFLKLTKKFGLAKTGKQY